MRSKDLPKESERQEGVKLHKVRNDTPLESQGLDFDVHFVHNCIRFYTATKPGEKPSTLSGSGSGSSSLPLSTDRLLEDRIYLSILAETMDQSERSNGDPRRRIERSVQKKVEALENC